LAIDAAEIVGAQGRLFADPQKINAFQTAAQARANEATVADAMTADLASAAADAPAFFFHLGDVAYYFGEAQYYYDQFYDPYRAYDRPIFAIPGNYDGAVFGTRPKTPLTLGEYTLVAAPLVEFGFLTLIVDMAAQPATLAISFDLAASSRWTA
jgi:hypothetical protein